jgi:uncharacterized protein with von Willebrand factor type A (vWA) domain
MAREDLTEIAVIMDESGSMQSTKDDAIGGFNSFIASQKEVEGEANVTLVLFDNKYEVSYIGKPIEEVVDLDDVTYTPGGGTALIDAMGKTVDELFERLSKMPEEEKPGKVILIIITDGMENSSNEYNASDVSEKTKDMQDRLGWEVIFIGASQDVLDQAKDLGVREESRMTYTADSFGTRAMYSGLSEAVTSYRGTGSFDLGEDSDDSGD